MPEAARASDRPCSDRRRRSRRPGVGI